jgi:hypothetical protein
LHLLQSVKPGKALVIALLMEAMTAFADTAAAAAACDLYCRM